MWRALGIGMVGLGVLLAIAAFHRSAAADDGPAATTVQGATAPGVAGDTVVLDPARLHTANRSVQIRHVDTPDAVGVGNGIQARRVAPIVGPLPR